MIGNGEKASPLKVMLSCTGVGIMDRGVESFARSCFDGLYGREGLDIHLVKGRGGEGPNEHVARCIPRNSSAAAILGRLIHRNPYIAEQLSSLFDVVRMIRGFRPHVVFTSDANLMFQLYRWRRRIGVPFRLLYHNGGPIIGPFIRCDHVQQVTPTYWRRAIEAGEPPSKHSFVPEGFIMPKSLVTIGTDERRALRRRLDLPADRSIVLTVGAINTYHKRMHYVIDEIAALPTPRPYLVLLGQREDESAAIIARAAAQLGVDGFAERCVPYDQVDAYYAAADVFALGSLKEGFGRVYVEALSHGLPCVAHDGEIMRFVIGEGEFLGDFAQPGSLRRLLPAALESANNEERRVRRFNRVKSNFSWDSLAPRYIQMFRACHASSITE